MARRCELTGKQVLAGNNVSHSNIKTRRRFLPNLQEKALHSDSLGRAVRLKVSTNALRSVEHNGGLDNFLLKADSDKMSLRARRLKKLVQERRAA